MNSYISVIKEAVLFFPIIAVIFTLPYILYSYRKYGTAIWLRSLIVYSFILYLICTFFLVILPLPSKESVKALTTPRSQLIPFNFIQDILKEASKMNQSGFMAYINNPAFYQFIFNILMLLPFGVYLHYYFECDLKKTVLFSFLLSLFFEVTQLTGLFFLYPRGYRLFDVDDLFANTLGGFCGYYFAFVLQKFLPTRKEIDKESYKKGQSVSCMRRGLTYVIDYGILILFEGILSVIFHTLRFSFSISFKLLVFLYFTVLPLLKNGQTFGMRITKIRLTRNDETCAKFYELCVRFLLFYGYLYALPHLFTYTMYYFYSKSYISNILYLLIEISFLTCFFFSIVILILHMLSKKQVFYEKYSKTKYVSTVEVSNSNEK